MLKAVQLSNAGALVTRRYSINGLIRYWKDDSYVAKVPCCDTDNRAGGRGHAKYANVQSPARSASRWQSLHKTALRYRTEPRQYADRGVTAECQPGAVPAVPLSASRLPGCSLYRLLQAC